MGRIPRFLRLPSADRRLLLASVFLLGAVRLGLGLLSFCTLQRLLAGLARDDRPAPAERVIWAVGAAGRALPRTSCLSQALVTQALLGRCGHPADLRIGVRRGQAGELQAHAWVESKGRVVFGGANDRARYVPLTPAKKERS